MAEGLKIVIAEDNALIAMDLADLLEGMGHDVCAMACTETETVDAALRHEPDLLILDGLLAEGSGVVAMRQILTRGHVAHLYVTGDPHHILQIEPDAVIVEKPFNLQALVQGIAAAGVPPRLFQGN